VCGMLAIVAYNILEKRTVAVSINNFISYFYRQRNMHKSSLIMPTNRKNAAVLLLVA